MYSQTLYCVWAITTPLQISRGRQSCLKYGTRRHSWINMISRADQCNDIGTYFRPHSDRNRREKFKHSWDPRNGAILKEGSYSCRCSMTFNIGSKNNDPTCLAHATEVTEYAKHFKLNHWCFCGLGQEHMVSHVREQTWDHIVKKMTQMCGSFTANVSNMLNHSRKDISTPRRASRPFTFKVRLKQRQCVVAPFWHAISYACTPQCVFGLISTFKRSSSS